MGKERHVGRGDLPSGPAASEQFRNLLVVAFNQNVKIISAKFQLTTLSVANVEIRRIDGIQDEI
jgi:hypothetical protein